MSKLNGWEGLLEGQRTDEADLTLQAPDPEGTQKNRGQGCSKPFIGRMMNGERYWLKTKNNEQNPKIPVVEQIVGRAGHLISAGVCEVKKIRIPKELAEAGQQYKPDIILEEGISHGSKDVKHAQLVKPRIKHYTDNSNSIRIAHFVALYQWCYGNDPQWLRAATNQNTYYSHDHGHYFPSAGRQRWDKNRFLSHINRSRPLPCNESEVNRDALERAVSSLEHVGRDGILNILKKIPTSWDVTNQDLELVGHFLEERTSIAASNIRNRFNL